MLAYVVRYTCKPLYVRVYVLTLVYLCDRCGFWVALHSFSNACLCRELSFDTRSLTRVQSRSELNGTHVGEYGMHGTSHAVWVLCYLNKRNVLTVHTTVHLIWNA
jgi:hypothetical protein